VTFRFGVGDLAPPEVYRPGFAPHDAEPPAGRAGLLGTKKRGLSLQEILDRPLGHSTGCDSGHLFDVVSVEVEFGSDLLVNPSGDNLPPTLGHPLDAGAIHRW
jgi:hypothetical protein